MCLSNCLIGIFSNMVRLKICRIVCKFFFDMATLADNRNMHINRHRNPDLALYCIFGSTKKRLDSEMFLDPRFSSWIKTELWQIIDVGPIPVFESSTMANPFGEAL